MTTAAENEILTRTGPGTAMGTLMRQYWIPAAMSSELTADGDPMRLMILGEKLIAFRDSAGKVGIMDHRCPHRCASLFFGRNEEGGLRCVYHGWKFDADGNCLDMANVPPHQDFKAKVRAKSYKTAERNGLVWVYMGDQENVPDLPAIPACLADPSETRIWCVMREANWLQGLEGEMDTSHLGILHLGQASTGSAFHHDSQTYAVQNRAPEYAYRETEVGVMYGAYRPAGDEGLYWRVGHFAMPFWAMMPVRPIRECIVARAYVPMDDTHTMIFVIGNRARPAPAGHLSDRPHIVGYTHDTRFQPNTTDWFGRWRLDTHQGNDWLIDRDIQRTQSPSGIDGVINQDDMVTTSMGAIVDRTFEHLGPSDLMITRIRKRLLDAAQRMQRDGAPPPGAAEPSLYTVARSGNYVAPGEPADWVATYEAQLAPPAEAAE